MTNLYELISTKWIKELRATVVSELIGAGFKGNVIANDTSNKRRVSFTLGDKISKEDHKKYSDAVYKAVDKFTTKHDAEMVRFAKDGTGRITVGFNKVPGKVSIIIENDKKSATESFINFCEELLK